MTDDFEDDDDDLEELDDDDLEEEEVSEPVGFDDEEEDDLVELEDDGAGIMEETEDLVEEEEARPAPVKDDSFEEEEEFPIPPVKEAATPKKPDSKKRILDNDDFDVMEGVDDFKAAPDTTAEDDDAAFFEEVADEGDDLSLGEAVAEVPVPPPPPPPRLETPVPGTAKPTSKAVSPMLYVLPALAVLAGIGFYLSKGKESTPPAAPLSSPVEKVPSSLPSPSFKKPVTDTSIPSDYEELKKIELTDTPRIISLTDRGLLKKNVAGSNLAVDKLVLILYKTADRYVVAQTYYYSDGSKWTVETHFAELDSEPEEIVKAFDGVYAG